MNMKIITNNVPRDLIYGFELTAAEREEMDYYSDEEIVGLDFFRYKGQLYDLSEFSRVSEYQDDPFSDWQGYQSNSYFSGIVVRYTDDIEQIIVGRYSC